MADDLEEARRRRTQRGAKAGTFGPSLRKQQVINRVMLKVAAAEERRDRAAGYPGKTPTPERITQALDLRGLYGPEVDRALGGVEPMVDEWEAGTRVPDFGQVQALADLTGFPVAFFYQPPPPELGPMWMCGAGGCDRIEGRP